MPTVKIELVERDIERLVEVVKYQDIIVEKPIEITKYVEIEKPVERVVFQEVVKEVEIPVERIVEKMIEVVKYVDVEKPYEVVKYVEIEKPVEKMVIQEVVKEVEVPVVHTKVEYVDRIVEKIVEVGTNKRDNCISEYEFVDLWNRMHSIPMNNLSDACLTPEKFVYLVSENIHGRKDKEVNKSIVYNDAHDQNRSYTR